MGPASEATTTNTRANEGYRLPRTVEPVAYRLVIEPDFEQARFLGSVDIDVVVHRRVDEIVLNAADLDVVTASVKQTTSEAVHAKMSMDEPAERAHLHLPVPLATGKATVSMTFAGALNDQIGGFYCSTFNDVDGTVRTIGTTAMFLANARRTFPCWDEPDRKATFEITLVVDENLTAVSNAPVADEVRTRGEDGRVKRRVHFLPTMKMSTYLVAFVVGPLEVTEPVDASGTPVRVVHAPGKGHLTAFALDAAKHALGFFTDYFGLPYPEAKLDLVGIPDFPGGGAENPGCITFHETALLVDPITASRAELERVATVVHHEIAHLWFGDLVTMEWWDGAWLNEGFTTFMELLSIDHFRPAWNRWTTFGIDREVALSVDGLHATRPIDCHVESPHDAEEMFDVLTYKKGAAVLRMLEQYLGPETFRKAVRYYLKAHAYGNTVTGDFWNALDEVSGERVGAIAEGWVLQGGHPLIHVDHSTISQEPFAYLPAPHQGASGIGSRWSVPLLVRDLGASESKSASQRVLLDAEPITLGADEASLFLANAGGSGAYRVAYSSDQLDALAERLSALRPLERFDLLSDTWALVLSGTKHLGELFSLAAHLGHEEEAGVFQPVVDALDLCDRMADRGTRPAVAVTTRALLSPRLATLGVDGQADEHEGAATLRSLLFEVLGTTGKDASVREDAAQRFDAARGAGAAIDPNLEGAVLSVVADLEREGDYEAILARYRHPVTRQEERRCLKALCAFSNAERCLRTFELALTEARSTDGALIVSSLLANSVGGPAVWERVKAHWQTLLARLPRANHVLMVTTVPMLFTDRALAEDVKRFLIDHPFPAGTRAVNQALERLAVNVRLAEMLRGGRLDEALARVSVPHG